MNYLNFKNKFPKSTNKFLMWVSNQNPEEQNKYVDNVYFYQFFSEYFEYRQTPNGTLFIDNEKEYFTKLRSDLVLHSENVNHDNFFNYNGVIFSSYVDTNEEYIRIDIDCESSFESAFFVLERLIENEFYVR